MTEIKNINNKFTNILIGEKFSNFKKYVNQKTVIITDTNVYEIYRNDFSEFDIIVLPAGEQNKTLETVNFIYRRFLEMDLDRSSFILAVGGGIVCDTAAYAASTYMRGLDFGFVASTLLAQVDASIGGKNGVNFSGYKNIVGTFNHPKFVICDTDMLNSLPVKELRCGLGEIVKHALIKDIELFEYLKTYYLNILNLENEYLLPLIYKSLMIKAKIVDEDEKEKGIRKILNFGHTLGHAIEKCGDEFTHGEAISIGMVAALALSCDKKMISFEQYSEVLLLLKKLNLPTMFPEKEHFSDSNLLNAILHDKKREDKTVSLILLNSIGSAEIVALELDKIKSLITTFKKNKYKI